MISFMASSLAIMLCIQPVEVSPFMQISAPHTSSTLVRKTSFENPALDFTCRAILYRVPEYKTKMYFA